MSRQTRPQVCIATVIGKDRVGIIARLAVTFARANVNILDVDQRVMEDTFVMTMAVDVSGANVPLTTLKKRLDKVAKALDLQITLHDERIFEAMHRV